MPASAIYVGRPTRWGNFPARVCCVTDRYRATELYRSWIASVASEAWKADVRRELGGHDLVCWCPFDEPCHADVLLELANGAN